MPKDRLLLRATMMAHNDWVTAIATPTTNSDTFVTSSHDKSLILWTTTKEDKTTWLPRRRLTGHSHFVEDVALSSDGEFAISGSWDGELFIWDLQAGNFVHRSIGPTKDVSGWWYKSMNIWNSRYHNIRGRLTGHRGYVNTVAISPDGSLFVSGGEDGLILFGDLREGMMLSSLKLNSIIHSLCFFPDKYWLCVATEAGIAICDLETKRIVSHLSNGRIRVKQKGHGGSVNTVAVTPEGSLCASGGKDGVIILWDLPMERKLYSWETKSIIHRLCFSPNKFWVCAATESGIMIWDLESKNIVVDLKVQKHESVESKNEVMYCTSLSWSADGSTLFSGYTDGVIRVWTVS